MKLFKNSFYFLFILFYLIPSSSIGNIAPYSPTSVTLESGREPITTAAKKNKKKKKKAPKSIKTKSLNTWSMLFFVLAMAFIALGTAGILLGAFLSIYALWLTGLLLFIVAINLAAGFLIVQANQNTTESVLGVVPIILLTIVFFLLGLALFISGLLGKLLSVWLPGILLSGLILLAVLIIIIFVAGIRRN